MLERPKFDHPRTIKDQTLICIIEANWRAQGEKENITLKELNEKGIVLPGMKIEDEKGRLHIVEATHKNGNIVVRRQLNYRIAKRFTKIWVPDTLVKIPKND